MTAQTYTILAYVVVGVLLWGYAAMLALELKQRKRAQEGIDRAE